MKFARSIAALFCVSLLAAGGTTIATSGQLLAYQDGFVFFTNGDGFRVAPNVIILDAKTQQPTTEVPRPRLFARAVFDANGTVTEIDLSNSSLPPEPGDATRFAVALSSPVPNPDLGPPIRSTENHGIVHTYSGRPVVVTFTVEVPPSTPATAQVYITTDKDGWDAQAIPMDRVDVLHFRVEKRLNSGTVLYYLYDRGSLQSVELGENRLTRPPREIVVTDADVRAVNDTVYEWADNGSGGLLSQPIEIPTPYNPAPFPNMPQGFPTPHD